MRKVLAVAAMAVLVAACQPTEPASTITAKPDATKPVCGGGSWIRGKVTPAGSTGKVVLQRTRDGKWEDWVWRVSYDSRPLAKLVAQVDGAGVYNMPYAVPLSPKPLHLRVRSEGGTRFSSGFYVTPGPGPSGGSCPLP